MWIREGDYLTIVSPIEGSPAEAAGLRPGDQITAINGEDMTGSQLSRRGRRCWVRQEHKLL